MVDAGYGMAAGDLDPKTVLEFIAHLPRYAAQLAAYQQDGNTLLFRALDELLDRAAAGVI